MDLEIKYFMFHGKYDNTGIDHKITYCLELLQDELPPGQVKCSKLFTFVLVPDMLKKIFFRQITITIRLISSK